MVEKENIEPSPHRKEVKRYTHEKEKLSEKQSESQTGPQTPRGKKQRRQFKLAPNRG